MKPRIAIFFTGGTISMSIDPTMGGAAPALSGEEIVARVAGLSDVAELDIINFARLPGPHVTPAKMLELAQIAEFLVRGKVLFAHPRPRFGQFFLPGPCPGFQRRNGAIG